MFEEDNKEIVAEVKETPEVIEKVEKRKEKEVVLSVNDLNITFKTKDGYKKAVDRLSFNIKEGSILGFVGESGSGKSSVSKALIRLLSNYSGVVQLGDDIISGKKIDKSVKKRMHKNMQFIFQDAKSSFNPSWDVYKILSEPLKTNGVVKEIVDDMKKDYEFMVKNSEHEFTVAKLKSDISFFEKVTALVTHEYSGFDAQEWKDKIMSYGNPDDSFSNALYDYEKYMLSIFQFANNALEEQKDSILRYYDMIRKRYRLNELEPKESELFAKMRKYVEAKREAQYSMQYIEVREQIRHIKDELISFIESNKQTIASNKHMLKSLFEELQNEQTKHFIWMMESKSNEDYNINWVKFYAIRECVRFLKKIKLNSLSYLSNEEIVTIKDVLNELIALASEQLTSSHFPQNEKSIIKSKEYYFQYTDLMKKKIFDELIIFADHAYRIKETHEAHIKQLKQQLASLEVDLVRAQAEDKRPNISNETLNMIFEDYEKSRREHHIWYVVESSKLDELIKGLEERKVTSFNNFKKTFEPKTTEFQNAFDEVIEQLFGEYKSYIDAYKTYTKVALTSLPEFKNKDSFFSNKNIFNQIVDQIEIGNYSASTRKSTIKQMITHMSIQRKVYKKILNKREGFLRDYKLQVADVDTAKKLLTYSENVEQTIKEATPLIEKKLIYEALRDVGLAREHAYRYTWELSDIQLQRVSVARAIIARPKVIIADEPIAALDVSLQVQIVNLIKAMSQKYNIAILFVTEDLAMIEKIVDDIMVIYRGKVIEYGPAKVVYKARLHPYTRTLFNSIPTITSATVDGFEEHEEYSQTFDFSYAERPRYFKFDGSHIVFGQMNEINLWSQLAKIKTDDLKLIGDYIFDNKGDEGYVLFDENKYKEFEVLSTPLKELLSLPLCITLTDKYYAQGTYISNDFAKLYFDYKSKNDQVLKNEYKSIIRKMNVHRKELHKKALKLLTMYRDGLKYDGTIYHLDEEKEDNYVETELAKLKASNLQNIKNNEGR